MNHGKESWHDVNKANNNNINNDKNIATSFHYINPSFVLVKKKRIDKPLIIHLSTWIVHNEKIGTRILTFIL